MGEVALPGTRPAVAARGWAAPIGLIVLLLVLLALPQAAAAFGQDALITLATRILILGIAAASLNLVLGYGGMVSFGHAAYYGIGAYAAGILTTHAAAGEPIIGTISGTDQLLVTLPVAMLAGGIAAAGLGALSLRTSGVQFIMITLAFAQMLFFFFVSLKAYGGDDGLIIRRRNVLPPLNLRNDTTFYYVCLSLAAIYLGFLARLVRSRFGMVLGGIRQSPRRMAAVGISPYRYQLVAFVISGMGCGLAGALMANFAKFVSPDMMHWTQSGELMIMVILGGVGTLLGPFVGAAALIGLDTALISWTEHWQVIFGPALIGIVLVGRGGHRGPRPDADRSVTEPLLAIASLVKRFGGLVATDRVTLDVRPGELHALIGPNGAGKSTLIAQLMGDLRPSEGEIRLDGAEIGAVATADRVARGIARTFQITDLLPDYSALDNVALAVQARRGHGFRFWSDARRDAPTRDAALGHLGQVGLAHRAGASVSDLAQGERKQLELAVALACRPRLLLLDEPMAGLGPGESRQMIDLLSGLKGQVSMLLVEHDMDAVFALADRISVLVYGRIVASGTVAEIQADPAVKTAYLGEGDA